MAPRAGGKRRKVGLTRMDAALDAMRPLGFSDSTVKKSVKNLLRVYGNDGWAFIEEAAYKVLIDTILEVDEQPQLNLIEYQQQLQLAMCEPETLQVERSEEHKPLTLEYETLQPKLKAELLSAPVCTSPALPGLPTIRRRRPCYGWISDDEDDDFVVLTG